MSNVLTGLVDQSQIQDLVLASQVRTKLHLKRKTAMKGSDGQPMEVSYAPKSQLPQTDGSFFPEAVWAKVFGLLDSAQDQKAIDLTCKKFHRISPLTELNKIRRFLRREEAEIPKDLQYSECFSDSFFKRSIRAFLLANAQNATDPQNSVHNEIFEYVQEKIAILFSTAVQLPDDTSQLPVKYLKLAEALWLSGQIRIGFLPWAVSPPQHFSWFWDFQRVKDFILKISQPCSVLSIEELKNVDASVKVLFEKSSFKAQCKESDPAIADLINIIPRLGPENLPLLRQLKNILKAYCYSASGGNHAELLTKCSSLFNDNSRLVKKVVSFDGLLINFASQRMRKNYDIGLTAVKQNGLAYPLLDPELQKDPRIIQAALDQNPKVVDHIPKDAKFQPACARKIRRIESVLKKSANDHPTVAWSQVVGLLNTPAQ